MPSSPIPALALSLTLTACAASAPDGVQTAPLPIEARQPCTAPAELLGGGDWRLIVGRMGDALITCEGRRGLAVQGYDGLAGAVGG